MSDQSGSKTGLFASIMGIFRPRTAGTAAVAPEAEPAAPTVEPMEEPTAPPAPEPVTPAPESVAPVVEQSATTEPDPVGESTAVEEPAASTASQPESAIEEAVPVDEPEEPAEEAEETEDESEESGSPLL